MPKTAQDYWDSIKDIATEAREEHPNPDDNWNIEDARLEYIWETVTGSEWITHPANNETVLNATNNENAIDQVELLPTMDWKQIRLDCALYAMLQDVQDAISKVRE